MTYLEADGRVSRANERETEFQPRRRYTTASDDTLLEWGRTGDPEALGELYRRHHRDALRYAGHLAHRYLGHDAADDIVAESVRKVLTAIRRGRGPVTGFRPYLFTAIRSVTFTAAARPGRVTVDAAQIPETPLPGPDEDLTSSEARDALASLPRRWQQVLWETSVNDVGHDQLAATWGVSSRAVASVAMRARAALRIAFVRSHLPRSSSRDCDAALDLVARLVVTALDAPHQDRLDQHLEVCDSCRRARSIIDAEFASWSESAGSLQTVFGTRGAASRCPTVRGRVMRIDVH